MVMTSRTCATVQQLHHWEIQTYQISVEIIEKVIVCAHEGGMAVNISPSLFRNISFTHPVPLTQVLPLLQNCWHPLKHDCILRHGAARRGVHSAE